MNLAKSVYNYMWAVIGQKCICKKKKQSFLFLIKYKKAYAKLSCEAKNKLP
jgi:hypothetical protein